MAVTTTLSIEDKYSREIFTRDSLASATTYNIFHDYDGTNEYTNLKKPVIGDLTIKSTLSETGVGTSSGYVYIEQNGRPTAHYFSTSVDGGTVGSDTIGVSRGFLVGISVTFGTLGSPSLSPSISSSISASISSSLSPSISSSISPSASLSPSLSASISPSPSPSISSSISPSASLSPSISPSISPSA